MPRFTPRSPQLHRRRGFTLIEILVVITILAILVAFLVPALGKASSNAKDVQVRTDISSLESAIAQFKTDFNMEPPSGIGFFETGADWTANANVAEVARSRALIRQLWPQYDFNMNRDINRDGDTTDTFNLVGIECLVFFLGGAIAIDDANNNNTRDAGEAAYPAGFSKNPVNPFAPGGNRQGPYFEFQVHRLIESSGNPGFFGYRDTLSGQTKPYLYLSSYGGKGYRPADLGPIANSDGTRFVSWYVQGSANTYLPHTASPGTPATNEIVDPRQKTAWLATKYQIISPGADKEYGNGGPFDATNANTTPLYWLNAVYRTTYFSAQPSNEISDRSTEADNITNFHSGRLGNR